MKNSEICSMVESTLEQIRIRNQMLHQKRREAIFTKIPKIPTLYDEQLKTAIEYSNKQIRNEDTDFLSLVDKQKAISEKIQFELVKSGYPANYLEPIYDCASCNDTGQSINGNTRRRCNCFYLHTSNVIYSMFDLGLPKNISFSAFDLSLFSGYDSSLKIQKNDYMSSVKNLLVQFCMLGKDKNYYLFGKTGTGKTFFLISMAEALLKNGVPSLYITSNNLFKITQEYKASVFSDEKTDPYLYSYIYLTNVLLIDDLGTESITQSKYSELLEILNQRIQKGRSTIIASNLSPLDLKKTYDERIYSRIIGTFDTLKLPGDDLRLILKRRDKR